VLADTVAVIVGTAVTVGAVIASGAVWAFKAVVAQEVTPSIVTLSTEANALTREFQAFRQTKDEERRETRAILADLDKIVRNHDTRITVLEQGRGR
jgi:hypothetical protein